MATTQTNSTGNKGKMQFKPASFDVKTLPPSLPIGGWLATSTVKLKNKDGRPMLIVEWKTDEATGDDAEDRASAVGGSEADFINFFDDADSNNAQRSKMNKLTLRKLCEALEVDLDVIPTKWESEEDFAELIAALDNRQCAIWTTHRTNDDTGEIRVKIHYTEPGAGLALAAADDEEEEKPKAKSKTAGSKTAAKSGRR